MDGAKLTPCDTLPRRRSPTRQIMPFGAGWADGPISADRVQIGGSVRSHPDLAVLRDSLVVTGSRL
jgi:hypothetical protein